MVLFSPINQPQPGRLQGNQRHPNTEEEWRMLHLRRVRTYQPGLSPSHGTPESQNTERNSAAREVRQELRRRIDSDRRKHAQATALGRPGRHHQQLGTDLRARRDRIRRMGPPGSHRDDTPRTQRTSPEILDCSMASLDVARISSQDLVSGPVSSLRQPDI